MSFMSSRELKSLGLKSYGRDVLISKKASIYGASNISIGNNVRIDDFCIISSSGGQISIGNHIHIGAYSSLFGGGDIEMKDFTGLSSYVALISASDDFSGNYLVGPTMDEDCLNLKKAKITMERYTICGCKALILPGVTMAEGSILGANSMAVRDLEHWHIYSGSPAKKFKAREDGLIKKAEIMEERWK